MSPPPHILVVDDEAGLREMLSVLFRRSGYRVEAAAGVRAALETLEGGRYDVVVTDLLMPDGTGMEVLEKAHELDPETQVIMITAYATCDQAVEAMRNGAYDFVQKPFRNEALRATVDKALEKRAILDENRTLRAEVAGAKRSGDLVGKSPAIKTLTSLIERVADAPSSVLITGESGAGKEVVARSLHTQGQRGAGPFVAVNCGALPPHLMESELFGHEKGAFTGAAKTEQGLFRASDGGTLFLDEIAELPIELQVKLLRVLQDQRVRPVGSNKEHPVDVRVLAATNRDIEASVAEGSFRQDLFYRLNVIRLHVPPLRERPEDIPVLAAHFLERHAKRHAKNLSFETGAFRLLMNHGFPGNVRELENLVERAVTLSQGPTITGNELLPSAGMNDSSALDLATDPTVQLPEEGIDLDAFLAGLERTLLQQALERSGGIRTRAAKLLRTSFRSLRYRLAKYGLKPADEESDL